MDAIEIRVATPDDADAVADYHDRCFRNTYSSQLLTGELAAPDREGTRQQLYDWFRPESDVETQVAVVDGVPIAHLTVSGHQLLHLFVEPDHQGMGLGGRLLAQAEAMIAAGGHRDFELHARVDNVAAIAFYEAAGWTVTDRLIHTDEHGISYDEHVLVKDDATSSDRTPLRPVDTVAAEEFWRSFKRRNGLDGSLAIADAFQFGDSYELANELADLVVNGPKRATCGTVAELEAANEAVPAVGDHWVVCDGSGHPVAVMRTTDIRVGPLSSVDDQFAWDEGEGDRSRAYWLDAHMRCFTRAFAAMGRDMHPDIEVVFERFELL